MVPEIIREHHELARAVSRLCGWTYFFCWSASFYPQPILNWRRKSTAGTAIDFPTLNVLGFFCLTISNTALLLSPQIRQQYAARNPLSPEPTVEPNDLAFAVHALILCLIIYSQYWPVGWGFKVPKYQRTSRAILGVFWGSLVSVLISIIATATQPSRGNDPKQLAWLDVIYIIGYVKLLVTFLKYIPQAWLNFKRKSTVGWSIGAILFDFSGGMLSITQLVLDSSVQGDWGGVTGNPIKFGLGNVSMFFDVIFMVQHYILYRKHAPDDEDGNLDAEAPLA